MYNLEDYTSGGNESDEDYDIRISALVEGADDQTVRRKWLRW